jgi:predicted ATPase
LRRMEQHGRCQVIMATHAPVLMAYPTAQLLHLTKHELSLTTVEQTEHFKLTREFCADPAAFVAAAFEEDS